jgi:hypothetical protein
MGTTEDLWQLQGVTTRKCSECTTSWTKHESDCRRILPPRTNEPETIGTAVSSGCFRMTNTDIVDLYGRVSTGTKVVVE